MVSDKEYSTRKPVSGLDAPFAASFSGQNAAKCTASLRASPRHPPFFHLGLFDAFCRVVFVPGTPVHWGCVPNSSTRCDRNNTTVGTRFLLPHRERRRRRRQQNRVALAWLLSTSRPHKFIGFGKIL
jgi:hypothetical protein